MIQRYKFSLWTGSYDASDDVGIGHLWLKPGDRLHAVGGHLSDTSNPPQVVSAATAEAKVWIISERAMGSAFATEVDGITKYVNAIWSNDDRELLYGQAYTDTTPREFTVDLGDSSHALRGMPYERRDPGGRWALVVYARVSNDTGVDGNFWADIERTTKTQGPLFSTEIAGLKC